VRPCQYHGTTHTPRATPVLLLVLRRREHASVLHTHTLYRSGLSIAHRARMRMRVRVACYAAIAALLLLVLHALVLPLVPLVWTPPTWAPTTWALPLPSNHVVGIGRGLGAAYSLLFFIDRPVAVVMADRPRRRPMR